jgi:hypothetical protein
MVKSGAAAATWPELLRRVSGHRIQLPLAERLRSEKESVGTLPTLFARRRGNRTMERPRPVTATSRTGNNASLLLRLPAAPIQLIVTHHCDSSSMTHSRPWLPRAGTRKADISLLPSVRDAALLTLLLPTTPGGVPMKCSKCQRENRTTEAECYPSAGAATPMLYGNPGKNEVGHY